jgi:hypothetical protein
MQTVNGETAATIAQVIDSLQLGIRDGRYQPDDILITSKDPEGNGFVAFVEQEFRSAERAGVEESGRRYRIGGEDNAVLVMAMFEIDPER